MIGFNVPPCTGNELTYMGQALQSHHICGDGPFTARCSAFLESRFGARKALLTTSGTAALDMAALLCDLQPGDEVILPSFTFSSTATAFALRGAHLVFVDIRPDTMNLDERKIESAITERTKVIVPVHYAGISCDMDAIRALAEKYGLLVVEDAAQGVMSTWHGRALGTLGDFGCYSFHETKNYSMGEGGALMLSDPRFIERAEILREKGTNRSRFFRGQVDKYTWVDLGDSFLPSELSAAHLWAQLEQADAINARRLAAWNTYDAALRPAAGAGFFEVPTVPEGCVHNAHMYYLKCRDLAERTAFIAFMREAGIQCVFHYIPLHSSPAGQRYGVFRGADEYTTRESERLVRLPLYDGITPGDLNTVISTVLRFFGAADHTEAAP